MLGLKEYIVKFKDGEYMLVSEGTGENLWDEDRAEGYVDYIMYNFYETEENMRNFDDYDGGMVLCEKYVQDMSQEEILERVLDLASIKPESIESVKKSDL